MRSRTRHHAIHAAPAGTTSNSGGTPQAAPPVSVPFTTVTNLGTGTLGLRSQHVVASWNGLPIVVMFDGGKVYVVELNGTRHVVASVSGYPNPTISSGGGRVVVYWQNGPQIKSSTSTDLTVWSKAVTVATVDAGGPIPCASYTPSGHVLVWVSVPKTSSTGGMDGYGPLYVGRTLDGASWVITKIADRSALAVCAEGGDLVISKDEARNGGATGLNAMMTYHLDGSAATLIGYGFDAAIATDGTTIAVGYHVGVAAHVLVSKDAGKSWTDTTVDPDGKFVQVGVTAGSVSAIWVDFPDAASANDPRGTDTTHRATAWVDGTVYKLNNGEGSTLQGNLGIVAGKPVAVYTVNGTVMLAQ